MANVSVEPAVTKVVEQEKIVLALSRAEAEAVLAVLGRVGYRRTERVARLDSVFNALKGVGVQERRDGVTGYVTITA
ncbi:hypothetical protein [Burkholderia pseudomallei]|uniref:hypothetical protein n=1 Tax=Burkholderia pseudomallei TaxID=28450 RepID=UPI0011785387|nr:hypothetical protein [Burkholderia pseudomallei]